MREINVSLLGILEGLTSDDIVTIAAAKYAEENYGVDIELEDLDEVERFVNTSEGDLLLDIQNTFANIDREYGEEEEEDNDEDHYWDNDEEEEEEDLDSETQRLIEENRRKNEAALGL